MKAFSSENLHRQDRVFNPGGLPPGIRMQDILSGKIASNHRNKQIASIFKEAGIIEKYGSGIKRVRLTMTRAGAPAPPYLKQ
ncbi:MAG: ATP-binding protein [Dissulfuribacterales bacterium]